MVIVRRECARPRSTVANLRSPQAESLAKAWLERRATAESAQADASTVVAGLASAQYALLLAAATKMKDRPVASAAGIELQRLGLRADGGADSAPAATAWAADATSAVLEAHARSGAAARATSGASPECEELEAEAALSRCTASLQQLKQAKALLAVLQANPEQYSVASTSRGGYVAPLSPNSSRARTASG